MWGMEINKDYIKTYCIYTSLLGGVVSLSKNQLGLHVMQIWFIVTIAVTAPQYLVRI